MLTIGSNLPSFDLKACVSIESGEEFADVTHKSYPGKWIVLFAWPLDFTFVCPTEIAEFGRRNADFAAKGAQVLGLSADSHYVHLAWRNSHPALRDLPFPMLADNKRSVYGSLLEDGLCDRLGIIHPEDGVPIRATFISDPDGKIRWASANDLSVGRNVDEVLRVLDALQTGELTPCGWTPGDSTLGK